MSVNKRSITNIDTVTIYFIIVVESYLGQINLVLIMRAKN